MRRAALRRRKNGPSAARRDWQVRAMASGKAAPIPDFEAKIKGFVGTVRRAAGSQSTT
jgi:hypothetical protein